MSEIVGHPLAMNGEDPSIPGRDVHPQAPPAVARQTRVRRFEQVLHDYRNCDPPGRSL